RMPSQSGAFSSKRDIWPSPTRSRGHRDTTLQSGTVPPKAGLSRSKRDFPAQSGTSGHLG
ncbi:unnamed protein product, partial [Nesidiocoris tenuis]